MHRAAVTALRVVIVLASAGGVFIQGVMIPLILVNDDDSRKATGVIALILFFIGVLALQVIGVCVWRLLTMVRRGTVFSFGAFRYVDVIIGATATGSVLMFAIATVAAVANRTTPGDEVAPGLVALMCGMSLVIAGAALLVWVLRNLLAQAVALDDESKRLQAELREVI